MTLLDKQYIAKKKEDISGTIVGEFEEVITTLVRLPRQLIVDTITELEDELARYKKLLIDIDGTSISITP